MKKIMIKLLLVAFLLTVFVFGVVMPQYGMSYLAAFQDKLCYAESVEEPKIILMGDSNLAFGIDSEKIEQEIGMPVVNMGLHGGLGQTFCMDMARGTIKAGDIVIIAPAYYGFGVGVPDGVLPWTLLENHLDLWKKVNVEDYATLVKSFPTYFQKAVTMFKTSKRNVAIPGVYSRAAFTQQGDIESTGNENILDLGYVSGDAWSNYVNQELVDYYNDYSEFVKKEGGVLLAACPPMIDSPEQVSEETFKQTYDIIKGALNFDFISEWEDYIFPMEYFYDTNYHLNDVGRVYRTKQLIEDIQEWMRN